MNLTRLEQETVIVFNAAEDTAEIETFDPVYIRKLDKLCDELPNVYKKKSMSLGDGGSYVMPKKLLRFAKPTERHMTEEQKAAARDRLAKARERKAAE